MRKLREALVRDEEPFRWKGVLSTNARRGAYANALKIVGVAALVFVPAFLTVSSSALKELIGRYFEDCNVIIEAGDVERVKYRSLDVYRKPFSLHLFGDTAGHAQLYIETFRCRIEYVEFGSLATEDALFRHPNDPTPCTMTDVNNADHELCRRVGRAIDGLLPDDVRMKAGGPARIREEGRSADGEGAVGEPDASGKAAHGVSLYIADFSPFYDYGVNVVYSAIKDDVPCDDLEIFFRPKEPRADADITTATIEGSGENVGVADDGGEHIRCRVEHASWVNYYARASQGTKIVLIVVVSVLLSLLLPLRRDAKT